MPNPLLTRRSILLAKIETTYGVDAVPTIADAILASDIAPSLDVTTLDRNYYKPDVSPNPVMIGRKLNRMAFSVELMGNGKEQSGIITDAPIIGRLLRACGFSESAVTGTGGVGTVNPAFTNVGPPITWGTITGTPTVPQPVWYTLTVVLGGASGVATVKVDPDAEALAAGVAAAAAAAITSGTAFPIAGSGASIAPTFAGNLVAGDKWIVEITGQGIKYRPVSTGFESVTLYAYLDGLLHKMPGAIGTVSIRADAGGIVSLAFDMTGIYVAPIDTALPGYAAPGRQPPRFERAKLLIDTYGQAVINSFTYAHANTISVRPDASSPDGYIGVRVSDRTPTGGIDPEATLAANYDWWANLSAANTLLFRTRVGTVAGNMIWMSAPAAQYTGLTYRDRDGVRVYDAGLRFNGLGGDDEFKFLFA